MYIDEVLDYLKCGKKIRRTIWPSLFYLDKKEDDRFLSVEDLLADDWEVVAEKKKWWKPELDEKYYFICNDDSIYYTNYDCDDADKRIIDIGNCFQTEDQAEFMAEKLRVIHELEKFAYENNEEEAVMVFTHLLKAKYFFRMEIKSKKIQVVSSPTQEYLPFNIYFDSEEIARKAIETIGEDRIKKYYFGVSE